MTRDLAPSEWKELLEDFSRTHRAWLATIDTVSYGRPARVRIIQRRLRSLVPDTCGDRVMGLEIRFQEKSHLESAVQITAPVTLRVDETPEGDARGLEIVDETGSRTRIRLQTVPSGDVLDGMAPGELSR